MAHDMTVGENEREKNRKLDDWESNGNKFYLKLGEQRQRDLDSKNKSLKNQCQDWLDMQVRWKD
jgi:hypothetical protein